MFPDHRLEITTYTSTGYPNRLGSVTPPPPNRQDYSELARDSYLYSPTYRPSPLLSDLYLLLIEK